MLCVHDVSNIYHVPLMLVQQRIHTIARTALALDSVMAPEPDLTGWTSIAHALDCAPAGVVSIALVGKYTSLQDSYLSVLKALLHSAVLLGMRVDIVWVEAADLEDSAGSTDPNPRHAEAWGKLKGAAGCVIPGGFGVRGVEGMILAAKHCRETRKPLLGVCLGFQVMVLEAARSLLGRPDANSEEFNPAGPPASHAIIHMLEVTREKMGGTMRLGSRPTGLARLHVDGEATLAARLYGFNGSLQRQAVVSERHRHRYEVNPVMVPDLEAVAGLRFTGTDADLGGTRMEVAELPVATHPFYLGCQFHPEFQSRPGRPAPLFFGLVAASAGRYTDLHLAGELWQKRMGEESPRGKKPPMQSPGAVEVGAVVGVPSPYRKRSASISLDLTPQSPGVGGTDLYHAMLPSPNLPDSKRQIVTVPGGPLTPGGLSSFGAGSLLSEAPAVKHAEENVQ